MGTFETWGRFNESFFQLLEKNHKIFLVLKI